MQSREVKRTYLKTKHKLKTEFSKIYISPTFLSSLKSSLLQWTVHSQATVCIIIHSEGTFSNLPLLLFASCSDTAVRNYHRFSINPAHSTVKFYSDSDHLLLLVLLPSVVGRTMTTEDVHVVIPGIFGYVRLHGKEELSLRIELRMLIGTVKGKDYLGLPRWA